MRFPTGFLARTLRSFLVTRNLLNSVVPVPWDRREIAPLEVSNSQDMSIAGAEIRRISTASSADGKLSFRSKDGRPLLES